MVCDRHMNTTGLEHIDPTGKGHTTGGTADASAPAISGQQSVIHKDYVLDYTSPMKNVIMEYESGSGGLTYRYVYGLGKLNVVITGIPNGAGGIMQYVFDDETGEFVPAEEYHCYHIIPIEKGGTNDFDNLCVLSEAEYSILCSDTTERLHSLYPNRQKRIEYLIDALNTT